MKRGAKFTLFSLLLLFAGLVVFISCREEETPAVSGDSTSPIELAKKQYSDVEKNIRGGFSDSFVLNPEWDKSDIQQQESDLYTVSTIIGRNRQTGATLSFVFVTKPDDVYKSQLLERVPDKDYFEKHGFDDQFPEFTGQLIGYSLTTRFLKATMWKEGTVSGYFVPEKILSDIGQRNQRIASGEPEPPGGWGSGNVLNEVTVIGQKPVNQVSYIVVPAQLYQPTGGTYQTWSYTGHPVNGGGQSTLSPSAAMAEIFLRFTSSAANPCYAAMTKKAQSSTLVYNKITTIASNFNISAVNNLAVTNEYRITSPAEPMRIVGNIIYFNDAYLGNASQEYMVAAYLHEILHAYIGLATAQLDHDDMSYNYITPFKDILVNIFPNLGLQANEDKLTALAWNGLNSTRAWQDKEQSWKDSNNTILNNYLNGSIGTTGCP